MSSVTLTYGGVPFTVYCNTVQVGWKNNNMAKSKANGGSVVEVVTQSFENPVYTLQGVHLVNEGLESTSVMTYSDLLAMAKNQYTGSNAITLGFTYSQSGSTESLVGSDGSTTAIPVVIESFNFPINARNKYSDGTNEYYIPVGTIVLRETA